MLKRYQERALKEVSLFLEGIAEQQASGNVKHASDDAWDQIRDELRLPGRYNRRQNGLGTDPYRTSAYGFRRAAARPCSPHRFSATFIKLF